MTDQPEGGGGPEYGGKKIQVFQADIPEALQKKAIERVVEVLQRVAVAKDIASDMKKHFDQECGGTWHCVVGRSFGCSVTHETKYLLFFRCEQTYVLLFKSQE
eukprot:TRINITY_DN3816_c0_g1_i1.p3 TRINITY_DN3816_c0_g1~~TRINITY_DN3816_c0_g1_i1.p3  ORF type:complete len:103 (-),score=19.42 TRINITY_DN3816_c0_g1_i1:382-690(-)